MSGRHHLDPSERDHAHAQAPADLPLHQHTNGGECAVCEGECLFRVGPVVSRQVARAADAALHEVGRAVAKFPTWPTDPLHALAVLGEEFGELTKATLQHTYEPHKATFDDVREEAVQTAAMALRFLASLDDGAYFFARSEQHKQ